MVSITFSPGGPRVLEKKPVDVHDHAGGAEPALETPVVHEGLLERMERPVLRHLDGRDLRPLDLLEGGLAGPDGLPVDHHRARPADPDTAPVLGPGELEVGAEDPEQRAVLVGLEGGGLSVELKADGLLHG